jgi:hypothetical protein
MNAAIVFKAVEKSIADKQTKLDKQEIKRREEAYKNFKIDLIFFVNQMIEQGYYTASLDLKFIPRHRLDVYQNVAKDVLIDCPPYYYNYSFKEKENIPNNYFFKLDIIKR